MKVKLIDGTEIEAQVKEEDDSIFVTTTVSKLSDASNLYDLFTNFNLSKVIVTYTDNTYSEYKNLKIVGTSSFKRSNVFSVTIILSNKTEFEMTVESLNEIVSGQEKEIAESSYDITKMQIALAEVFERLLAMKGGAE